MANLYIVATPIGNLMDLSPRAIEVLKQCDLIAAEDTRVTIKLLNYFAIKTPQTSYHEHNEESKGNWLIQKALEENLSIALVSDAGTPCISDPGSRLVKKAYEAGIKVIPVPGASAVITALSASGFDIKEFTFYGFLPREKKAQQEKLTLMGKISEIAVIYESPHRIISLLKNLVEVWPHTQVTLFSDLTKHYEKVYKGDGKTVLSQLEENPKANKGEYVAVFFFQKEENPSEQEQKERLSIEAQLFHFIYAGFSMKESIHFVVKNGEKKNEVYQASLNIKNFIKKYKE